MRKKFIDLKLFMYVALFYTITLLIDLARKTYWKLDGSFYQTLGWKDLILQTIVLDWVIVLSFMTFVIYLTRRMFEKKLNWKLIILVHLSFSFLLGIFSFAFAGFILMLFGTYTFDQVLKNLSIDHYMSVIDINFLAYFSMIGIVYIYFYIDEIKNVEQQKAQLKVNLAETKFKILETQLHPHFMFNTLNSISSLIEVDKERSQNLIADFGDLFRAILSSKDENVIRLEDELNRSGKYLDIVSVRFSDHLEIRKTIEPGLENALVPVMLLQPILENAIKYGYSYNNTELLIDLRIYTKDNYLFFHIQNNGALLKQDLSDLMKNGIGLSNTRERLAFLYGDDFEFSLRNIRDLSGVEAVIKIPYSG